MILATALQRDSCFEMGFTKSQREEFDGLYKLATMSGDKSEAEKARLRQLLDQMLKVLREAGLAKERYMHPKSIVPHSANRGTSKMRWQKIYEKGAKIISVGVSLQECGPNKAIAFYEDPLHKVHAINHINLCKTSEHYAVYEDVDAVDGGSVGCGHWNQMLACIHDKRPVPEKWVKHNCEEGNPHLDPVRLSRGQPDLQKLVGDGLNFTMIPHAIEKEYPRLPDVFQKALNIEHHIGEGLIDSFWCLALLISKVANVGRTASYHERRAFIFELLFNGFLQTQRMIQWYGLTTFRWHARFWRPSHRLPPTWSCTLSGAGSGPEA